MRRPSIIPRTRLRSSTLVAVATIAVAASLTVGCTDDRALDHRDTSVDRDAVPQEARRPMSPTGTAAGRVACDPPTGNPSVDVMIQEGGREVDLVSFDGTDIRLHWLPHPDAAATDPRPTVLMGPGWSLSGATGIDDTHILGSTSTRSLQEAGYNILTWDPRGFGVSGGTAMIDSAEFEGRDVQMMIDWLATLPQVELDADRDPRLAMIGGSYGGGIALVGAAVDCRVDAVVATAAWHSLESSLYRSDTVKIGWIEVLVRAAIGHSLDDHITDAIDQALGTGVLSDEVRTWFADRGPGDLIDSITAPVLLIQGTIDTLFTLDEAVANYRRLLRNDVEVAMLWNCDGHGLCLTDPGDQTRGSTATIQWLARHLLDDDTIAPGPGFETIDQNGVRYVADRYVDTPEQFLVASGSGRLRLTEEPGVAVAPAGLSSDIMMRQIAADITPGPSQVALEVTLEADRTAMLVGRPVVELRYRSVGPVDHGSGSPRPVRVFAQLVDAATGLLIGNQTTPVPLVVDGREHSVSVPLEMISHSVGPGSRITLQLAPTSVTYAVPMMGPTIEFENVELRLPVADWLQRDASTPDVN